jgi:hypothetical protein
LKFKNHSYTRAPNGQCPAEIQMAAQQLQMAMPTRGDLQGYVFFWAVLNFSKDPSMNAGKAMEPPMSAKVSAEKSGARVAGEAPKLEPIDGSTYLFSDCPSCKSMIPGQLTLSEDEFYIIVVAGYVDWSLQGDQATSPLKARVVLEDRNTGKVTVFETDLTITASRQNIDSSIIFKLSLLSAQEVGSLPRSRYRVGVYLSNALTNKYNSWEYFWTNILLQHQQ